MTDSDRFLKLPEDFLASPIYPELPPPALKVLAAIGLIWIQHNLHGNHRIIISYEELIELTGINDKRVISQSLKQLIAVGLLTMKSGTFKGRKRNAYGITWLPGPNGGPPMKAYLEIKSREEARRLIEATKQKRGQSEWLKGKQLAKVTIN